MADTKQEYIEAYRTWLSHLEAVHKVLLEGQRLEPPKLKGLLNREALSKERYDRARRQFLGLSD
jgi:uncharacterized protein YnzC (UPF0291/DUF896 family)